MGTRRRRRRSRRRQKRSMLLAVIVVVIAVFVVIGAVMVKKYTPSKDHVDLNTYYGLATENSIAVIYDNERQEQNGFTEGGQIYINYETVRAKINRRFYWDPTENILRYVTPEGVVSVSVGTTEYNIGKGKQSTEYTIVKMDGEQMYLALDFIKQYTDIRSETYDTPNRVVISDQWGEVEYNELKKSADVRVKGGIKSEILAKADRGTYVTVLESGEKWDKVCTKDGFIGYVKKSAVGNVKKESYLSEFTASEMTHATRDGKINLVWHQVTNQSANGTVEEALKGTKGVNVISPTWFYMNDNEGGIKSLASQDYVNYCHQNGVEVWGLVSNLENTDVDVPAVLNQTSKRDNLVNQLIAVAIQYDLDGLNVDFEALSSEVGDGYIQFIRELALKCGNNGIVLSVDNYVPSEYTALYDREEQAAFADYIVLMAYDEHYVGSEEGSVASLDFVKKGVADTLQEVPAEQLILGIPFYTREWEITPINAYSKAMNEFNEDASEEDQPKQEEKTPDAVFDDYSVISEAIGMDEAQRRVEENNASKTWSNNCGQYYCEYEKDGKTYKIWLEDSESIDAKLQVYTENNLAGVAFWKLGFENSSIWDTIIKYVN